MKAGNVRTIITSGIIAFLAACHAAPRSDFLDANLLGAAAFTDIINRASGLFVSSYLYDPDGTPVANSRLSIAPLDSPEFVIEVETDELGQFATRLVAGTYIVNVEQTDGTLFTFQLIVLPDGSLVSGTLSFTVTSAGTAPVRVLSYGDVIVSEGATANVSVRLLHQPAESLTFNTGIGRITGGASGFSVSPNSLTFTPDNYDIPQGLTVHTSTDGRCYDRQLEITLRNSNGRDASTYLLVRDVEPDLSGYDVVPANVSRHSITDSGSLSRIDDFGFDAVNGKLLATGMGGSGFLEFTACNGAMTTCSISDAGSSFPNASPKFPTAFFDDLEQRLLTITDPGAPSLFLCTPGNPASCTYESLYRPAELSDAPASVTDDPLSRKLLGVSAAYDEESSETTLYLHRCNLDGTGCTLRPLATGVDRKRGRQNALLIPEERKLIAYTGRNSRSVVVCNNRGGSCEQRNWNLNYFEDLKFGYNHRTGQIFGAGTEAEVVGYSGGQPIIEYRPHLMRCDSANMQNCTRLSLPDNPPPSAHFGGIVIIPELNRLYLSYRIDPESAHGGAGSAALIRCHADGTSCANIDLSGQLSNYQLTPGRLTYDAAFLRLYASFKAANSSHADGYLRMPLTN